MTNLEMILNFMEFHPVTTILIVFAVFSWTPIKIIHNHGKEDDNE